MKEAIVRKGPTVEIVESSIPKPGPDEVVIKMGVSGTNPKDWKMHDWGFPDMNNGNDITGYVHALGSKVTEFHVGDRIAGFNKMYTPGAHGSYAEYAVSPANTTFHLPKNTSFEEAATVPLCAMTAAVGLFLKLGLPQMFLPATNCTPLLIYGASGAVGAFAVQLAKKSQIHPLICIAGRGVPFVETLIDSSKGDVIIDYRDGEEAILERVRAAIPSNTKLLHAFDCISDKGSHKIIAKVLSPEGGQINTVLPIIDWEGVPDSIIIRQNMVGSVHAEKAFGSEADDRDFGYAYFRLFSRGLAEGWLKPHPYEVVPGGLDGLQKALTNLKKGKNSGVKYVLRISETEGVDDSSS